MAAKGSMCQDRLRCFSEGEPHVILGVAKNRAQNPSRCGPIGLAPGFHAKWSRGKGQWSRGKGQWSRGKGQIQRFRAIFSMNCCIENLQLQGFWGSRNFRNSSSLPFGQSGSDVARHTKKLQTITLFWDNYMKLLD